MEIEDMEKPESIVVKKERDLMEHESEEQAASSIMNGYSEEAESDTTDMDVEDEVEGRFSDSSSSFSGAHPDSEFVFEEDYMELIREHELYPCMIDAQRQALSAGNPHVIVDVELKEVHYPSPIGSDIPLDLYMMMYLEVMQMEVEQMKAFMSEEDRFIAKVLERGALDGTSAPRRNQHSLMLGMKRRMEELSEVEEEVRRRKRAKKRHRMDRETTMVLRRWVIDHLDNPYPTPEEKEKLAVKTSLRMDQLNQWMVNARRRLVPAMRAAKAASPNSFIDLALL